MVSPSHQEVKQIHHIHYFSFGHDTAVVLVTLTITALTLSTVLAFNDMVVTAFRRVNHRKQLISLFYFVIVLAVLTIAVTLAGNRFLKTRLTQSIHPEDLQELEL